MPPVTSTTPWPRPLYAWYTLGILLLAYILSFIDRQLLSLLVGPIREDLAIGDFQFSLLSGWAFAIFYTFMGLPLGRLADGGRRTLIVAAGVALWSAMTAFCGLARNFWMLLLGRIGVGVGEAALSPSAYSLLSDSFPPARLPRAVAVYTLGITLGSGMAYLAGGAIVALVENTQELALPLTGTLRPWQLAFLAAGLPGLLVALLVLSLREPRRRDTTTDTLPAVGEIARYLWQRRDAFAVVLYAVPLLSIAGYAYLSWYPEFLIRSHGVARSHAGYITGWLYLICGTAGTLSAARFTEYLAERGYRDAPARVTAIVAVMLPLPVLCAPLAPSLFWVVLLSVPAVFLLNAFFGVSLAALQLITPNRMRAQLSAFLLLLNNLLGLGFGTSLVAVLSQFVFRRDASLGLAMALVGSAAAAAAAFIAWRKLRHYPSALLP